MATSIHAAYEIEFVRGTDRTGSVNYTANVWVPGRNGGIGYLGLPFAVSAEETAHMILRHAGNRPDYKIKDKSQFAQDVQASLAALRGKNE